MIDSVVHTAVRSSQKGILRALLYFDIFDYPLTEKEIENFSPIQVHDDLSDSLAELIRSQVIYQFEGYYTIHNNRNSVHRRLSGNRLAEARLSTARTISKWISIFPFVRAVLLSGSISKGFMDEHSDIDYFIITEPGRLWIVRSAMAFFRRIFFLNSRRLFCTNYFIDSDHLEISEKNMFTAVEVATLKPMFGKKFIEDFQKSNQWCGQYLPNRVEQNGISGERDRPVKMVVERMLASPIYDRFDQWLMHRSLKRWKTKYGHLFDASDFSIAFQSTTGVSRSHPGFYQKRVLTSLKQKTKEFEEVHALSLTP